MTRRSPKVALLIVGILAVTGCGARVDDSLRQAAADEALGRNTGTNSQTGGEIGEGSTGGSTGSTGGTTTGAVTTGGATTGGTTGGTTGATGGTTGAGTTGGSSTTGAPPGGSGGSTDVGVTATSLTVGNIADASGPVPGLFKGAIVGTQAYFAKINSEGGVFGRKIRVNFGDSQLDCGQNKAQTQARVGSVFAFVGSFSLYDDCGAQVLQKHLNVPNVSNALGPVTQKMKSNYSTAPLGNGWRTGPLMHYKTTAPFKDRFTSIGAIYAGVGTGPTIWKNTKAAIAAVGGKVVHDESYGATDTDFTGAVIRMRSAGVRMIYINSTDGATTARFVNAARGQNVDWPIVFGATAYDSNFLKEAGANAEGVYDDQQFAMFFNTDEAARIPAVGEFQKWMDRVDKGQTKDIFALYGWTSAQLFVQALTKAGPKATRKTLYDALNTITSFNGDGLLAPANPAGKKPATCWLLTQVKNGKFVRVTPSTGFRCDGTYYVNKG